MNIIGYILALVLFEYDVDHFKFEGYPQSSIHLYNMLASDVRNTAQSDFICYFFLRLHSHKIRHCYNYF